MVARIPVADQSPAEAQLARGNFAVEGDYIPEVGSLEGRRSQLGRVVV